MPSWTGPEEIAAQIRRLWERGRILAASVTEEELFPHALRMRRPAPRDLSEQFDAVRDWIRVLEASAKSQRGFGYEIIWEEVNNRDLGRNRLPAGIVVPSQGDALALIGAEEGANTFAALVRTTQASMPELIDWLGSKPLVALAHAGEWEHILSVLAWFKAHPRSNLLMRQIDVMGVDTKFIETRKGLLAELLDLVLPPHAIEAGAVGARAFETRYGLRSKPALVRFRILDPRRAIAGLTDLTVPAAQFAALDPGLRRVFITENEINGLAFPEVEDALVIFGLGYALDLLSRAAWLRACEIHYWGDIDTHGFVMLDRLRATFPDARSFLMDRETLMEHRAFWTSEAAPHVAALERLTEPETALYDTLRYDRLGQRLRLEQERISFKRVEETCHDVAGMRGDISVLGGTH